MAWPSSEDAISCSSLLSLVLLSRRSLPAPARRAIRMGSRRIPEAWLVIHSSKCRPGWNLRNPVLPYCGVATMNSKSIHKLFEMVRSGKVSPDEAVQRLRHLPFEDLGFAKIDHHRALRVGMPEVVFGQGKTPSQLAQIFSRLAQHEGNILATRATKEQFAAVKRKVRGAQYRELARAIVLQRDETKYGKGIIAVVSAGTSDIPVAEEAVVTAEIMGNDVEHLYDVGVAGIHRLLANREALTRARVVIVCAGMEGALPSVVGGLVGVPVIAVPTSVGYGAAFKGVAALLGMMNSCASNVSVVNIDNGFGAGYVAGLINRL
jgi:NCAIR mutase (PurE)-related protein